MSDAAPTLEQSVLKSDANFTEPLQRVSFQPGILLGADALSTEQDYHVRRLTRHQRWLVGPGTVFGMRVDAQPPQPGAVGDPALIIVRPGYGIDGLGRDVTIGQTYAISLRDWLNGPDGAALAQLTTLHLRVTVRAQADPMQLQPVVAELFDAGLDPVVAARIGDSFALEISVDPAASQSPPPADAFVPPVNAWSPDGVAPPGSGAPPLAIPLTARETKMLQAANASVAQALNWQSWLLERGFTAFDDSPGWSERLTESSRLLLATLQVTLPGAGATPLWSNIAVNNLVRPFAPNVLLSALALP